MQTLPLPIAVAERLKLCRKCGLPINHPPLQEGWWEEDGLTWPTAVTTHNGREYAHTACVYPVAVPLAS